MEIEYQIHQATIAEITSQTYIATPDDGLQLLGNLYFKGYDKVIMYESQFAPEFFDLKTKMAGEILQKFSTYRVRIAIVGKFEYDSKSLADFIFESNKHRHVNFVGSLEQAIKRLA